MRTFYSSLPLAIVLSLVCASVAAAQSFDEARRDIDGKLDTSLKALAVQRESIAGQKIPLSRRISKLEGAVATLRRERDELLKVRDSRTIGLSSLRRQVESLKEQEDFVDLRLNEFIRDFEGRLDISELPRYESQTAAAKLAENNASLDASQKRAARIAVVQLALQRMEEQLGGQIFPGEALSPEGDLTQGRFIAFGPSVFYVSDDGTLSGLVENRLNAADPVVVKLPEAFSEGLLALADSGRGALPLDATLGKAIKSEKARKSLLQYVEEGGPVGFVICGLGGVALLLTLFKSREILGFPVASARQVDGVLQDLSDRNPLGAAKRAAEIVGVSGELLRVGVENVLEKRDVLEELIFERVLRVRPQLERFLPFLAITAAAAPLLGLLGTVIGMIKTFQLITIFGTGDAKSLSSGISEALVTTALGLVVAIPTLILHGGLSRMAKQKLAELEQLSVAFVNGVMAIRRSERHD